jgi:thiamine biosynthesis protein ThiS
VNTVEITVNGGRRSYPGSTTVVEVVASLTEARAGVAVALNDSIVPRGEWARTTLRDGDRLEVLTAVQGG